MRVPMIIALATLASCGTPENTSNPAPFPTVSAPSSPAPDSPAERWVLQPVGGGVALALLGANDTPTVRLICATGADQLLVNVPAFRPIASEERLSFGSNKDAVALVADTRGDPQRGGVSGTGEVPGNLALLMGAGLSASYGAQKSGPHPAAPQDLTRAFVAACSKGKTAQPGRPSEPAPGACHMQGNQRLNVTPRRAIGTEPFWGARIEGRCVTYSHPEDQKGTRVWTRYTKAPSGESWSGIYAGQPFELRIRKEPGCSDGMSDDRYPLAAELKVNGEQRKGCAE